MIEYYSHSERHIHDGVEILRYRLVLPRITDKEKITDFYREVFDSTLLFCKGELCKYSEKKYLLCDLPKKKFNYPPVIYRLEGCVTYESDEHLFVKLTASVEQRESISTRRVYDAHAWSVSDERLLPPRMAAREYLHIKRLPKELRRQGFLVEDGRAYICTSKGLMPLELPTDRRDSNRRSKK